ncbi:MAG: DNA polymerase III subunit delta [Pseudomonadota bacterium]
MKLSARDAARFVREPDRTLAGVLIYGEDKVEVAARRLVLTRTLLGDDEGGDMRLTRIEPGDLRRGPAALIDAMKARGFFDGQQIVVVEDATDATVPMLSEALSAAEQDDAFLIVTAGRLPARAKLRKLFESMGNAAAAPCFADIPDRAAIREMLTDAGAGDATDDAVRDLEALARSLDRGTLRDLLQRLSLYVDPAEERIEPKHVAACAPGAGDVDLDETLDCVADGRAEDIGPLLARLKAQGQNATGVVIAAQRYFRALHTVLAASSSGSSVDGAIGSLRPPVFGPRRDALARRCRIWTLAQVEGALTVLLDTDNDLRGGTGAPGWPLLERAFLKLALTIRQRR